MLCEVVVSEVVRHAAVLTMCEGVVVVCDVCEFVWVMRQDVWVVNLRCVKLWCVRLLWCVRVC